eukprot:Gregarina_sp_Pseudo_9__4388@NODE_454_length_2805_cov_6_999277_g430_i0_p1_GENE_NODE_454_length_2805_cov_6_999277_g430_i0NODE_454_length_2805_cov_6_999277_g430_i0_p1_ORF_typecomplete_len920_score352_60eIF3c_N/PF05470_12/3_5e131PCI/PF01399_27/3_6e08Sec5/PF15469_6/0_028Sec5/PF15469_6/81HTH_7/PF02796_15/1_2e04HTH_7/PF02796_15/0_77Mor/PF08765_11/0_33DUF842/PF05811_13/1_2e03DUF842/PF05811_13/0_26_NODE_454_length_2805_cov_6_999277_g430_i0442677
MSQHMKNQDYVEIHEDFETLLKLIQKAQSVLESESPPHFLIRTMVDLESYVEERQKDKAAMKKCSKQKAQAINKLQRKIPAAFKPFRETLDRCLQEPKAFESVDEMSDVSDDSSRAKASRRAQPRRASSSSSGSFSSSSSDDGSSSADSSSSDSEPVSDGDGASSDSEADETAVKRRKPGDDLSGDESDSSSSSSSSSSSVASSSSSSSEKSIASLGDFETKHARAMVKWGFKGKAPDAVEKREAKKEAAAKRREDLEKRKAAKDKAKETQALGVETRRTSQLLANSVDLDDKQLLQRAQDVVAVRGKRGQERIDQMNLLHRLRDVAQAKALAQTTFEITVYLVTLGLDLTATGGLPPATSQWQEVYADLSSILDLLLANLDTKFTLSSTSEALADSEQAVLAGGEAAADETRTTHKEQNIRSIILSFIERLDDNLLKALQAADPHTKEYQARLIQTVDMLTLLWKAWVFYHCKPSDKLTENYRTALKLIEHLYYLPDRLATSKWKLVERRISESKLDISGAMSDFPPPTADPSKALQTLCQYIIKHCPQTEHRVILRAHLSAIYNLAIADEFWLAHEMFTSSTLNDLAVSSDVSDQILYNRTLTQIGLAAFRQGNVQLGLQALSDICGTNKQRELLAQGLSVLKGFEKSAEQEKAERRRLLPAHMHINLDVVETVYNICAMLIEIPAMCGPQQPYDYRVRPSRFRRALEQFEKSSTPPESSRESVIAGAKCLMKGDWEKCRDFIMKLSVWDSINPPQKREEVQALILHHVKSVALKAYILTFSSVYDSMSVEQICKIFDLSKDDVYSIVSKMIVSQELSAFWDADSETVLINRTKPSKLQASALALVDQVSALLEQSEVMQSSKLGTGRRKQQAGN